MSEATCPFCNPTTDEWIILETPYARAIADIRPVIVGHVLVTSTEHAPSALDLDEVGYLGLRLVQQEISRRIWAANGEVGAYEHGRSMLCRFHDHNRGVVHAHVHVLPASFNLGAGSQISLSPHPPTYLSSENDRYLYQETGQRPVEMWATGKLPIFRHFVRKQFQESLNERGLAWRPLELSPDDHEDAAESTKALLSCSDRLNGKIRALALFGTDSGALKGIAQSLRKRIRWPIVDSELSLRFLAWLSLKYSETDTQALLDRAAIAFSTGLAAHVQCSSDEPIDPQMRFDSQVLGAELLDPQLMQAVRRLEQENIRKRIWRVIEIELERTASILIANDSDEPNLPRIALRVYLSDRNKTNGNLVDVGLARPTWNDVRLILDQTKAEDVAKLIIEAWQLRYGPAPL